MPRILKRLVEAVQKETSGNKYLPLAKKPKRPKSLYDPQAYILPRPSLNPAEYSKSILLGDSETNIITRSKVYSPHKRLPPRVFVPNNPKARDGEKDVARAMTEQERRWWSNPYLRMLSSPMRLCLETDQYLPADLLVRLSWLRLPCIEGSKPSVALIPDGIQHTKFTSRKSGKATYVLCLREAVDRAVSSGKYRRHIKEDNIKVSSQLSDHVAHLLRLRVLQELELVGDQLNSTARGESPLVRRLTREELDSIKSTGVVPFKNAVAILEVPAGETNPTFSVDWRAGMTPLPPPIEERTPNDMPLAPLSTLMLGASDFRGSSDQLSPSSQLLPSTRVPFYNALTAFPFSSQRVALRGLLERVLTLQTRQRKASDLQAFPKESGSETTRPTEGTETSHAFLLCADSENVKEGDMASVAIALWRLRMFESGGWSNNKYRWSLGTNRDISSLL
ncbi:hypothetical protein CC2G_010319 [Coprinopsis cinerea AmutBmut pab1-1]|nr:hypothetical protein CC2G_010319 [Coprinopsis cinerea AmutBmut pab1-1]